MTEAVEIVVDVAGVELEEAARRVLLRTRGMIAPDVFLGICLS